MKAKVNLSHSAFGLLVLVIVEWLLSGSGLAVAYFLLLASAVAAGALLYVATEVIEEVRNKLHMLELLSIIVTEFVIFFAAQYYLLISISPQSFPTLSGDVTSLLLHSIMVFVFNPLYVPTDWLGRTLLLINTVAALGLVLFVLQNIWQIRPARVTRAKSGK